MGLFSLGKGRLWGSLSAALQNLRGAYRNDGAKPFAGVCREGRGKEGVQMKESRFRLDSEGRSYAL